MISPAKYQLPAHLPPVAYQTPKLDSVQTIVERVQSVHRAITDRKWWGPRFASVFTEGTWDHWSEEHIRGGAQNDLDKEIIQGLAEVVHDQGSARVLEIGAGTNMVNLMG